ncbi:MULTISPECIES: 4-(cytidine 5'-diphospho)-2-C-methyl-D-erythritol kinase [unclassified Gilliamella]|uniref:4-(cytidine 5'-diphospho)-2-C-methyl-D-erythritol kinase n=1 Tax=unclassified Gilliamella TaxID=2685620 RepID=UPI0022699EB8|nr:MULTISPECIES: 4-(cytidine 5'-diphospho)-2-C-methyl-D-erythritol kinase [unclassified Gilliamella]MCX8664987.1 4-(cytidine 5'-diphospho)-2-C-methyl-D-erythritol kinase [Gilliamella sp. B2887]MCX8692931.1 4-(cytidine 5'-diphospho)-2-C-methyl-D-erythritol kinase [Gilliamella sp. B2881]MCX8697583.1 4-(cytidine 5'-diphospho)-2-C-methyl-D-erythritol kinase [Gilliamella sp. B3000]MCX8656514.1 4-(cytidine 5'-diphospho)-2-C-methyl-D-erythritol kinase [Gilliamella sp. B2894]MCX8696284.1 4-(cytidine 5
MMKQWCSPAKLNLFLYITGRRPDNYHDLQTIFQFIDYCDVVTFNMRQDNQINLLTEFVNVPVDKNLMIIAANHLKSYANRQDLGVDITIDKKIPMGGGLGGASSNAATVLVALNQLWQLNLKTATLIEIGRQIGADVPIFIYGQAAFAQGIGDQFLTVDIPQYWYLVTYPNIEISTVKVFNDPELTRNTPSRNLDDLLALSFDQFRNDCEMVVRKRYPIVDKVIRYLSQFAPTRLTGTGACIFTQCQTEREAKQIQQKLNNNFQVPSFVVKALNKSPLYG